jgi:hypothetical protein
MRLHPGLSIDGLWGRARPPMLASKTSPTLSARRREAYQSIGEIAPPRVESPRVPKIPHSFCARLKLFDRKALLSARPILLSAPLLCTRICIDCRTFPSRTPPFPPFPWILSSESRLINGLRAIKRAKAFLDASPPREAGMGARGPDMRQGQDCSWGKLNLISVFLQWIVVRQRLSSEPFPFGRLNPKATRSLAAAYVRAGTGFRPFENHQRQHSRELGPQKHPQVSRDAKRRRARQRVAQHWQGEGDGSERAD